MSRCDHCGYYWADLDDEGNPISLEYCHYEGPDAWAPCEQDNYDEYANEAYIEEEAAYEEWLDSLQEEANGYWNTHAEPYDYGEDWVF